MQTIEEEVNNNMKIQMEKKLQRKGRNKWECNF
jgi:hypothetical protein